MKLILEMFQYFLLILTILSKDSQGCFSNEKPTISTSLGNITGKTVYFEETLVLTFQSIPYAKPPINDLRFKKPVPVDSWSGSLQADHLPPGCLQYSTNPFPWLDDLPDQTEDCLYLNVWSPADANLSNKKSVIFFIHGGGFRISSSRLDYFDGRVLAALGNVVVVTINYRLGPQGFLYSATEDAPGNMGLYDILEALKWVHANIESFGGNPKDVTLFGESAGAIAISMFMTSPLFKGLFTKAILSSGAATNMDAEDNERDFTLSQVLAEAFDCSDSETSLADQPEKVVQCLRGVDGLNLTKMLGKVSKNPQRSLYPRFGDEILPRNARKSFVEGNFQNINILIGSNTHEGSTMITKAWKDIFGFYGEKNPQINKTFGESIIRKNFKDFPDMDAVVKQYLNYVEENDYKRVWYQVQSASGDYARICPTVYLAEKVADEGNHVYYYHFAHRPSVSKFADWMGVIHFDETPFTFGYPLLYPKMYTDAERTLSRTMVRTWTNFAKSGTPSFKSWPIYSKKNHLYELFLTHETYVKSGPQLENCNFFRKHFGF